MSFALALRTCGQNTPTLCWKTWPSHSYYVGMVDAIHPAIPQSYWSTPWWSTKVAALYICSLLTSATWVIVWLNFLIITFFSGLFVSKNAISGSVNGAGCVQFSSAISQFISLKEIAHNSFQFWWCLLFSSYVIRLVVNLLPWSHMLVAKHSGMSCTLRVNL